jgi:hypothetical protein
MKRFRTAAGVVCLTISLVLWPFAANAKPPTPTPPPPTPTPTPIVAPTGVPGASGAAGPRIVDSNGVVVGQFLDVPSLVLIDVGAGVKVEVNVRPDYLVGTDAAFFESNDCSGPFFMRYDFDGLIPRPSSYIADGILYYNSPQSAGQLTKTIGSAAFLGGCTPNSTPQERNDLTPAGVFNLPDFVPPFRFETTAP